MIGLGTPELKIHGINSRRNLLLCLDYLFYEFCYYVLTPSEFVLVPSGIRY